MIKAANLFKVDTSQYLIQTLQCEAALDSLKTAVHWLVCTQLASSLEEDKYEL